MNIAEKNQKAGEPLAALDDPGLGSLLDRVDGVADGIGEADNLRFRA